MDTTLLGFVFFMIEVPHEMIRASAGSGKTWQLTNRYIGLMGRQLLAEQEVTPERIIAVTFTRKAAGEFFDSILKKLALAATDKKEAEALAADKRDPLSEVLAELTQDQYLELLRIFIGRMPRLFLGTLDSFFSNVLRTFSAEYGLTGDFEIIDDHLSTLAREQVCRHVFERRNNPGDLGQGEFLEAFRQATFGREENNVRRNLNGYLKDLHSVLLEAPGQFLWGNTDVIWDGNYIWAGEKPDFEADFERLFALLEKAEEAEELPEGKEAYSWKYWTEFKEQAPEYIPGRGFKGRVEYMLKNILPIFGDVLDGEADLKLNRKVNHLEGEACEIVASLVKFFVRSEIAVRQRRTQGIWLLLNRFESIYSERIRRQGKLTFHDIELFLSGNDFGGVSRSPVLSQMPDQEDRLRIDYRLDACYDHWMLDEFQDTSYPQWKAIENLIDEVIQDTSETRSFFQVGDTKQAIYAWRGGDTRLFDDISGRYNANQERIQSRSLNVSWRSGADVIDMVNQVFGDKEALAELGLPETTLDRWKWEDHEVAPLNKNENGHCMVVRPTPNEAGTSKTEPQEKFAIVVALLEKIQPVRNGIECAILVQKNDVGNELVNYIRAHSDVPVLSESEISVATDNAINRAALSYLKCIAHPGDEFSWNHLVMTPFRSVIEKEKLSPGLLSVQGTRAIFEKGFEHVVRRFFQQMEESADRPLDAFNFGRAENLALAARVYDEQGGRDMDEFIRYARLHKVREPDTGSAVQVMTIHKSKGLTFDMAILPDLKGNTMMEVKEKIGVQQNQNREIEWVLDMPIKMLSEADPVLSENRKLREDEAAYESLCKFYVGLTRARYANYLVLDRPPKNSKSPNFVNLLKLTLETEAEVEAEAEVSVDEDVDSESLPEPEPFRIGELEVDLVYESDLPETTDSQWYRKRREKESSSVEPTDSKETLTVPPNLARVRVKRRTPSGSEIATVTGSQIFSRQGKEAREFGTLVHEFFEDIEWYDSASFDELAESWSQLGGYSDEVKTAAIEQVRQSLENTEIAEALSCPSKDAECWREKKFEVLLGEEWLSGTFDRVEIEEGRRASILDFKTDRVETAEDIEAARAKYRPQLETYRQVLSRMGGIDEKNIELQLLFTRIPKLITL